MPPILQPYVIALVLLAASTHVAASDRTILVVESYDAGFAWDLDYKRALELRLQPAFKLVYFALDAKRKPVAEHADMADKAWAVFQKLKPDMVILGDDAALSLLALPLASTATPVVYLGVNNNPRTYFDSRTVTNITGVLERPLVKRNIAQMRKLLPQARRILFLLDTEMTSTVIFKEIFLGSRCQRIEDIEVDVKLLDRWQQWQAEVLAVTERGYDAIFVGPFQSLHDGPQNLVRASSEVMRWTSQNSTVPVFALWDFAVGPDQAVGGLVLSGYEQGMAAADIALKIFGGAMPNSIYPVTASRGRLLFSRAQLRRFHIVLPAQIAETSNFTD